MGLLPIARRYADVDTQRAAIADAAQQRCRSLIHFGGRSSMWSRLYTSPGVLALAVVIIVRLLIWLRSRDTRAAIGLAAAWLVFMLMCTYLLVRSETPAEQMKRKIEEMAAAVKAQSLVGIFH